MARIVVDPVTRIEGHLRIEADVNGGEVSDAWSSGTMFRGIELILRGRDPREAWIWTQRICGVCTTVHALTSVRERSCTPRRSVASRSRLREDRDRAGSVQSHETWFLSSTRPILRHR